MNPANGFSADVISPRGLFPTDKVCAIDEGVGDEEQLHSTLSVLKRWLVSLIIMLGLYLFCLWGTYRAHRQTCEESAEDAIEVDRKHLPIILAATCQTTSVAMIFLSTLTIARDYLQQKNVLVWLFVVVDAELLELLWRFLITASSVSLYLMAPFAYFYSEAEGLWGLTGVPGRLAETCVVVLLVLAMFRMLLRLAEAGLGLPPLNFSFALTFFMGAIVCLVCTPVGLLTLLKNSYALQRPWFSRRRAQEKLQALDFEAASLELRLQRLDLSSPPRLGRPAGRAVTDKRGQRESICAQLHATHAERSELALRLRDRHALPWNILFVLSMLACCSLTTGVVLRIVTHRLRLPWLAVEAHRVLARVISMIWSARDMERLDSLMSIVSAVWEVRTPASPPSPCRRIYALPARGPPRPSSVHLRSSPSARAGCIDDAVVPSH